MPHESPGNPNIGQLIEGGARLFAEILSGSSCTDSVQWQVQNGEAWNDIEGANTQTFDFLANSGTYTVRCIVSNAIGQMISVPLTMELPLTDTIVSKLLPSTE